MGLERTRAHAGEAPWAVLTGDTLFIGDVGRPDLLTIEQEAQREGSAMAGLTSVKAAAESAWQLEAAIDLDTIAPAGVRADVMGFDLALIDDDNFGTTGRLSFRIDSIQAVPEPAVPVALATAGQLSPPSHSPSASPSGPSVAVSSMSQ